jgi:uncharacterized membrane protein
LAIRQAGTTGTSAFLRDAATGRCMAAVLVSLIVLAGFAPSVSAASRVLLEKDNLEEGHGVGGFCIYPPIGLRDH